MEQSNFTYNKVPRENVSDREKALKNLAWLLTSEDFLLEAKDNLRNPAFWEDIQVFCDQWSIPFQVEMASMLVWSILNLFDPESDHLSFWLPSNVEGC